MTTYDALCEMIALRDKTKSMEERMPYEIAVSSLGAQWESEKEAGEGFVRCGYVLLSEKFGRYMEPYFGCPRGALGHKFFPEGTSGISEVISYIEDSIENILVGPDEDYVCIPKSHIEYCMDILRDMKDKSDEKGAVTDGEDKG